ncbi:hypothetical protein ASPCADRAFT_129867 [Aspergillus carbonarius ITEM 5010]|uniref:Uncharacterized protein n=1 Tax=Aspergillus carbonarius (strain ITEM 5010) TaxID=602072 RepID=A0A1R3RQQ2_ASPC5|nr:hypothetical protein ASPCADRAFT_129867 [Aspergillus carbonarius ITEM 5010]
MGLIKTGIQLAGAYGLLRAGSKAANEYQEKKQSNQSQNHQCNCRYHGQSQPQYQPPQNQQPQYQQPHYQQPHYQQPHYQQPHYRESQYQQPQYGYDPRTHPNASSQYTPPVNSEHGPVQQNNRRYYASNGR